MIKKYINLPQIHQTNKAWLLDLGGYDKIWLPKSQCTLDTDLGVVFIPEWLVEEKGLN